MKFRLFGNMVALTSIFLASASMAAEDVGPFDAQAFKSAEPQYTLVPGLNKVPFRFPAKHICGSYENGCPVNGENTGATQYSAFAYNARCAYLGVILPRPVFAGLYFSTDAPNLQTNARAESGNPIFRLFITNGTDQTVDLPATPFTAIMYCNI